MNFATWLVRRYVGRVFKSRYDWVGWYRDCIDTTPMISFVLTMAVGFIWVVFASVVLAWAHNWEAMPRQWLYVIVSVPVLFYVYNWFAVMYEKYQDERKEVWETLKQ